MKIDEDREYREYIVKENLEEKTVRERETETGRIENLSEISEKRKTLEKLIETIKNLERSFKEMFFI